MSEVRKIDWSVVKPAVIGISSVGLALSVASMVDMSRQNTDLRRDLSELRVRFDQAQQNLALLQRLPPSAPLAAQSVPAPAPAPQPQTKAVAEPVEVAPVEQPAVRASASTLTFNMLMPGDEARPPLPIKAPIDGVPKSAKRDQPSPKREEPRITAPVDTHLAQVDGEKPRSGFVLLDKTAMEQPRQSTFKLIGQ